MTVMLYRHPGAHKLHGDMFDYVVVAEAEVSATLAAGWHMSTTEAKAAGAKVPVADDMGDLGQHLAEIAELRLLARGDKRRRDVKDAIAALEELGLGLD